MVLQALDADPRGIQRGASRFFVPRPLDSLHDVNEREEKLPISLSFSSSFPFASLCVQHAHVRLSIPPVPAGTQDYGDTFSCAMLRGNRPANTPCRRYDKDTRGQMGCTRKGQISTEQIPFYLMCFLECVSSVRRVQGNDSIPILYGKADLRSTTLSIDFILPTSCFYIYFCNVVCRNITI